MKTKNISRSVLSGVAGKTQHVLEPGETAEIPDPLAAIWIGRNAAEVAATPEEKDPGDGQLDLDGDQGDGKKDKKGKNN